MAIYYVWSAAAGSANGTSWVNAYTTLSTAFTSKAAGDVFYVAHDHVQTTGASVTLVSPGNQGNPAKILCVDRGGTVPPVAADRRTTAQVTVTGNFNLTFQNSAFYDGIIFTAGNNTSPAIMMTTPDQHWFRFDNCSLRIGSTSASSKMSFPASSSTYGTIVEMNNTTLSFANAGQYIDCFNKIIWRNTPSAVLGTAPTFLFATNSGQHADVECVGVDLSALAGSSTIVQGTSSSSNNARYAFIDCKLHASVTRSGATISAPGTRRVDFIRSGSAGNNYAIYSHRYEGLLIEETTIVRTGGASDGTTPISWKIVTSATAQYLLPFICPTIAIWNDTTGSAVTATVEGIWGGGAVPNDDEVWLDVEYLGDASSPQGSFVNDGKADLLTAAAAQTASSATWGGSTTKFKLNVSFTPQQKGWLYARVKCAKLSSTFYIDPLVTLT